MISVIIPLYNKEKSIQKSVMSVLNQSFQDFELIVVNDGSTDSSLDVLQSVVDHRLKVVNTDNKGVSSARNIGIMNRKFRYVAFLDADDYWDSDYLDVAVKSIFDYPQASIIGFSYFTDDNGCISKSSVINSIEFNNSGYINDYFQTALNSHLYSMSSIIIDFENIPTSLLFNEELSHGEDLDLYFRIALTSRLAFVDQPHAYYCLSGENRAMRKTVILEKHILSLMPFYLENKHANIYFDKFISNFIVSYMPFLAYNFNVSTLSKYKKLVNISLLCKRKYLIYKLPHFLLKYVYIFIYSRYLR